jgi:hypothetical protein
MINTILIIGKQRQNYPIATMLVHRSHRFGGIIFRDLLADGVQAQKMQDNQHRHR